MHLLVTPDNYEDLLALAQKNNATEIVTALMTYNQSMPKKAKEADPFSFDLEDLNDKDYVDSNWTIAIRSGGDYVVEAYIGTQTKATFPTKYGEHTIRRTGSNCDTGTLEELIIPKGYSMLKPMNARNLKKVTLPSSMKRLSARAFEDCRSLETVILPDSMVEIKERAFAGCTRLTSITVPGSLQKVDSTAFHYCPKAVIDLFRKYFP